MDPAYIKSMPERLGVVPHDSTSNQLWVDTELHSETNASLLQQAAKELKDQSWLHVYTRAVRNRNGPTNGPTIGVSSLC